MLTELAHRPDLTERKPSISLATRTRTRTTQERRQQFVGPGTDCLGFPTGLDQAGRRDYTVKVYPNGSHNLMEVPRDNPNESVRLRRFPPGLFEMMVDWTTTQLRRRGPARR